jgi:ATP-dependent helicase/DNAse subunit B
MPRRYLELEELRLARHVAEWLQFESARYAFEVAETEAGRPVSIAGLSFDVRLDRIDRLNDGSLLVIDYKSGVVSTNVWELPRPEDVQLPLYANFALDSEETIGGLLFAQLRPGKLAFSGRVRNAASTLFSGLKNSSPLVKKELNDQQLADWRDCIQQLARDFIAGRAEVDPRDYPKTCERCGLQTLCRIQEHSAQLESESESDDEDEEAAHD